LISDCVSLITESPTSGALAFDAARVEGIAQAIPQEV